METFDVLADLADRLVQFAAEPALGRPDLSAGQALAPGWVVFRQRARRPAPDAAEEAEGALDPLLSPLDGLFERHHEHLVDAQAVRPVFLRDLIGRDHVVP